LRVEPGERDLDRFVELRTRGDPHAALALWRGPPLADVEFHDFAQHEIERLTELRRAALEECIDVDLAAGRHRQLVPELERHTAEHPLREHLRAQLMLALYRSGRQADALAVYSEGRRRLVDELGLEPGEELRALEQAILRHDGSLRVAPTPSRRRAGRLLAAVVAGVVVTALLAGSSPSESVRVKPGDVAVLDAASGRVLASVPLGFTAWRLVRGSTGVWAGGDGGRIVRINPMQARIDASFTVGDFFVAGLAVDEPDVWVAETALAGTTIHRLDAGSGAVDSAYRLRDRGMFNRSAPEPLALAQGVLWASNGLTRLTRIDVGAHRVVTLVPDNGSGWVWASPTRVWSLNAQTDTVARLDPGSGQTVNVITLAQSPTGGASIHFAIKLDVDEVSSSMWVAEYRSQSVGRIDERTNAVVAQIHVGHPVTAVAAMPEAVWAASDDGALQRIDPQTNRVVQTVHLPGSPQALVLDHGRLYVTV
jgi:hypothetical protein